MATVAGATSGKAGFAIATASTQLVRAWTLKRSGLRLELHITPDIVTCPPGGPCDALVNPANEALVGTKLPYFPMLVEPPRELMDSHWCGMEAGGNMFYPMQVVDGVVHASGGRALRAACEALPEQEPGVRCRIGGAVSTTAGALSHHYCRVIHSVPPMYADAGWEAALTSCYRSALSVAQAQKHSFVVASPLLGAGARGAPVEEAARVAAVAVAGIDVETAGSLRFGVREEPIAAQLEAQLCQAIAGVE